MTETPRILVFTVSAWNSKVGANTWASLLEHYDSKKIANICLRDEVPDSPVCSRYFSISESKVLRSIIARRIQTGTELIASTAESSADSCLAEHRARYAKMKKKRRYSMLLARELVWFLGKWHTKELDRFLDDFRPDIVLYSLEGYIHFNRIVEYAIKRTGAKAIGYIWDDNFTYKQSKKIGFLAYRYFQRRSLKRVAKRTSEFLAISDTTKEEADSFFGIQCHVLTKPLNQAPSVRDADVKKPIKILYTGNLLIGRDRSLLKVVQALKQTPQGSFSLDVYTQTDLSDEQRQALSDGQICNIYPAISQQEVIAKQKEADLLLFLEDVDGPDAQMARLSFSTKITDYLSAGNAILAVGNKDTAPMRYFVKNKAAFVVSAEQEISKVLHSICEAPSLLAEYACNARKAGLENHDRAKILAQLDRIVQNVLGE